MLGETEALKLGGSPNHQLSKFGIAIRDARSEIGYTCSVIGSATERRVEAGPALGLDFFFQRGPDFLLAARPEFQRHALLSTRSEPTADVIAADDEIPAVIGATAYQDMDMGIVGVPMIDRDPVQFCTEVTLQCRPSIRG